MNTKRILSDGRGFDAVGDQNQWTLTFSRIIYSRSNFFCNCLFPSLNNTCPSVGTVPLNSVDFSSTFNWVLRDETTRYLKYILGRWSHLNSSSSSSWTFTKSLWFLWIFNTCLHKEKRWHTCHHSLTRLACPRFTTLGGRSTVCGPFIEWQATTTPFEVNQSFYDWDWRF